MKAIKCEMCGSGDVVKQGDLYVCQNCGTKYEPEAARKLMVEVDNSKELDNLYALARRARSADNAEEAEKYYSRALEKNPNDWEAFFFSAYFKALQTKQAYIAEAAKTLDGAVGQTVQLLLDTDADEQTATMAANAMYLRVSEAVTLFLNNAMDIHRRYYEISSSAGKDHEIDYIHMEVNACLLAVNLGPNINRLALKFPANGRLKEIVAESCKDVLNNDVFIAARNNVELLKLILPYDLAFVESWITKNVYSADDELLDLLREQDPAFVESWIAERDAKRAAAATAAEKAKESQKAFSIKFYLVMIPTIVFLWYLVGRLAEWW